MAVFFWFLVKIDASVRYCKVAYTVQVMFTRYNNNKAKYNWSPCIL